MPLPELTPQHRGLRRYEWGPRHLRDVVLLPLLTWVLLAFLSQPIGQCWEWALQFGVRLVGLQDALAITRTDETRWGLPWNQFDVYALDNLPSLWHWWGMLVGCTLLLLVSMLLSREYLPWVYLLRAVALLGLVSVLAFEFFTGAITVGTAQTVGDLLSLAQHLLWLIPLVHALVLYIFPLPWWSKWRGTWLAMIFVVVSVPLQAISVAIVAHHASVLMVMPLYMLATFLPQLLVQLALYGWLMSLAPRPVEITDRYGQVRSI